MEDLAKQRRVRFSGQAQAQDNRKDPRSLRGRSLPPRQQTESYKGDNKGQKWFRRQFSSKFSRDYDASDDEFVTATAAAAYAIFSLEEARAQYENITRKEDTELGKPPSGRISRRFSNKEAKNAGEASMRKSMGEQRKTPEIYAFPPSKPSLSSTISPSSRHNTVEAKANAWEKSQMEKIKRRSEKMKSAILAWENEKKMKAKLRMDKKKRELELRRERNLQHYNMKIASIDQIAGGAKAQVEEKRKNEELAVKEKAKRIRSTGKAPVTCFCF